MSFIVAKVSRSIELDTYGSGSHQRPYLVEMNVLLHLTEDQIHTIVDRTFESIPLNARGHLELRGYFNLGPHYTSRLCDYLTSDVMITTAKSNSKLHMKDIDVSISS